MCYRRYIANNINDVQYVVLHVDSMRNGCCSHIVIDDQAETREPTTTALLSSNIPTISVLIDEETAKPKLVVAY